MAELRGAGQFSTMGKEMSKEDQEMQEAIEARKMQEAADYPVENELFPAAVDADHREVESKFVRECIWNNERGDGTLYAELLRDRVVYNNNSGEWFIWEGHSWARDRKQFAMAMTSVVEEFYKKEIKEIEDDLQKCSPQNAEYLDNLLKAARSSKNRMLKMIGRKNCLAAAVSIHNPLSITGDELDLDPWALACKNGVIDLKTGKFAPGRPDQYITKASPIEWTGINTKAPRWTKFLMEILENDKDKVAYLLKLLGYAITGLKNEHIFPVLYGQHGRNGKGTIVELLYFILGPLAGPIPTEMLLRQRNGRSSSGPSPDIMSLKGRRIAIASEPNEGERFDMGKVKYFSGGDQISGRHPHDKYPTEFDPTHTLFLLTNEKPGAKFDDDALWERLRCIVFPFSYVSEVDPEKPYHRPANKTLADDLKEEAPGILASLVRGCLLWRKEGLVPPESVKKETDAWRTSEDQLAEFISDCCALEPENKEGATDLYKVFCRWWEVNRNKKSTPAYKTFGSWMGAKFERGKSNGLIVYKGVKFSGSLPVEYASDPGD